MSNDTNSRLPNGTRVRFNIGNRDAEGEAVILDAIYDDGWLYQIDVVSGDRADVHRNLAGELRAWGFEVEPL